MPNTPHFALIVTLLTFTACSGGGGDGGDPTALQSNWTGTWQVSSVTSASSDPGEVGTTGTLVATLAESGTTLTGSIASRGTFTGTLMGSGNTTLDIRTTYPEDGGTTTARLLLFRNGTSFEGTETWTWTDGTDTVKGVDDILATKIANAKIAPPPPPEPAANVLVLEIDESGETRIRPGTLIQTR